MSAARESFHASILAKRYSEAVITLNGLNMAEMLPALAAIGKEHREELGKALMLAVGKVYVACIQYALSVVYPCSDEDAQLGRGVLVALTESCDNLSS